MSELRVVATTPEIRVAELRRGETREVNAKKNNNTGRIILCAAFF